MEEISITFDIHILPLVAKRCPKKRYVLIFTFSFKSLELNHSLIHIMKKIQHAYVSVPFFGLRNFLYRYYESRHDGEKEGWLFSDWFSFSWQWGPSSVTSTGHGEEKSSPDWGKKKDEKYLPCLCKKKMKKSFMILQKERWKKSFILLQKFLQGS